MLRGLGFEREHFLAVFFHTQHQTQVEGVIVFGQRGEIGLHADQHVLGGGILDHIALTYWCIGTAQAVGAQLMLGMHEAGGEFAARVLGQVGRVVIGG